MSALTELAKGKPCLIRVPGICLATTDTTVWCHVRMIGLSGAGMKCEDLLGAFGCHACHSCVDGQYDLNYTAQERRLMLLEGVARTLYWLISRSYLAYEIQMSVPLVLRPLCVDLEP